jgi:purine-binding chemotaxis protein CheW
VAPLTPRSRILLVEAHHRVVGMLVDGVSQVIKVPEESVTPPEEFEALAADWIEGIVQLESRLIVLLDLDRALLLQAV